MYQINPRLCGLSFMVLWIKNSGKTWLVVITLLPRVHDQAVTRTGAGLTSVSMMSQGLSFLFQRGMVQGPSQHNDLSRQNWKDKCLEGAREARSPLMSLSPKSHSITVPSQPTSLWEECKCPSERRACRV